MKSLLIEKSAKWLVALLILQSTLIAYLLMNKSSTVNRPHVVDSAHLNSNALKEKEDFDPMVDTQIHDNTKSSVPYINEMKNVNQAPHPTPSRVQEVTDEKSLPEQSPRNQLRPPQLSKEDRKEKKRQKDDYLKTTNWGKAMPEYTSQIDKLDPLDDHVELHGFPTQPLLLDEVRMCDEWLNDMLDGRWTCSSDVTCRSCSRKEIARFEELRSAFRDDEVERDRIESLKQRFVRDILENNSESSDDDLNNPVVVGAVNWGQMYLFLNWVCSCNSHGIDPRKFTAMVASDEQSHALLEKLGFWVPDSVWLSKLHKPIKSTYENRANSGGHSDINHLILMLGNDVFFNTGRSILFHDVDMTWVKDPRPFLRDAGLRRDILGMVAPYYNAKGILNTGFVYVRQTEKNKVFMQTLENVAPVKKTSDQQLWNNLLRHFMFSQMSYLVLPPKLFHKYSGRRARLPEDGEALVYHAVGSNKKRSFEHFKQWFFEDGTCGYFDAQIPVA